MVQYCQIVTDVGNCRKSANTHQYTNTGATVSVLATVTERREKKPMDFSKLTESDMEWLKVCFWFIKSTPAKQKNFCDRLEQMGVNQKAVATFREASKRETLPAEIWTTKASRV